MRISIKSGNYLKKCLGFLLILGFISLGAIGGCNNNGGGSDSSGPGFLAPRSIAVEADGTLVVADLGLVAVVRVDPISGDRTIISDDSIGGGPGFISPRGIAVETDGTLVVTDQGLEVVVRVDPVTGDRVIISDTKTGSGP
jgi:streptogramin lyase